MFNRKKIVELQAQIDYLELRLGAIEAVLNEPEHTKVGSYILPWSPSRIEMMEAGGQR